MDYESLYEDVSIRTEKVKEAIALQGSLLKRLSKNFGDGDLQATVKLLGNIQSASQNQQMFLSEMDELLGSFDGKEYVSSGDFAVQMVEYCRKNDIDVVDEHPVYEMFPFQVKINTNTSEIMLGKNKNRCLRPKRLIEDIKKKIDKLNEKKGGITTFAEELADAYDLAIIKKSKGKPVQFEADVYLIDLYKILTPMQRLRKEYDLQSFAFDIARLYTSDIQSIGDGRKFQFGPSRNNNRAIRILDQHKKAQYPATIRFYD